LGPPPKLVRLDRRGLSEEGLEGAQESSLFVALSPFADEVRRQEEERPAYPAGSPVGGILVSLVGVDGASLVGYKRGGQGGRGKSSSTVSTGIGGVGGERSGSAAGGGMFKGTSG
jgi:hypothetical protein